MVGQLLKIDDLLTLARQFTKDIAFTAAGTPRYGNQLKWSLERFQGGLSVSFVTTLKHVRPYPIHADKLGKVG